MADLFLFFFRRLRSVTRLAGAVLIYRSFFLAFLASPGTVLSLRWACEAWGSTPARASCMAKARLLRLGRGSRCADVRAAWPVAPRPCAAFSICSNQQASSYGRPNGNWHVQPKSPEGTFLLGQEANVLAERLAVALRELPTLFLFASMRGRRRRKKRKKKKAGTTRFCIT